MRRQARCFDALRAPGGLVGVGLAGLGALLVGCGGGRTSLACSPYCVKLHGDVERCVGPGPGRCASSPFESVSLRDLRGRLVMKQVAGVQPLRTGFVLYAAPGRYLLGTTLDGHRIQRPVDLSNRKPVRVNLILRVR
jgi:hypothetical protein